MLCDIIAELDLDSELVNGHVLDQDGLHERDVLKLHLITLSPDPDRSQGETRAERIAFINHRENRRGRPPG